MYAGKGSYRYRPTTAKDTTELFQLLCSWPTLETAALEIHVEITPGDARLSFR